MPSWKLYENCWPLLWLGVNSDIPVTDWALHAAFVPERCKGKEKVPRVFMKGAAYELGSAMVPSENVY